MRIIAGKVMMDRHVPPALCESPADSVQQTRELIERWHGKRRLGYALTPRFAPTSSTTLLNEIKKLRQLYPDLWLQTHLSENPDEVAWVQQLFPDAPHYFGVYHQYQLTGERCVFAHCLHLSDPEWQLMAETGSAISFCPTSNLFLCSGLFNLRKAYSLNIPLGVGTDIGAGTSFSLLRTLAEAYKTQQLQHYSLCVAEAFYHATLGGAVSLDIDKHVGNFAADKEAEFNVISLSETPLQTLRINACKEIWEQLFVLMMLGDERNILQTWIDGECVWSNKTPNHRRGKAETFSP